jgi:hypothetical protein
MPHGERTAVWGSELPVLGPRTRRSAIGASRLLPRTPVRVSRPNRHRPFSLGGGNASSCPEADTHDHPHQRRGQVDKERFPFARRVRPMPWKPVIHCLKSGHPSPRLSGNTAAGRRAEISPFTGSYPPDRRPRAPGRRTHTGTCAEHNTPVRVMPERCAAWSKCHPAVRNCRVRHKKAAVPTLCTTAGGAKR